MALHSNNSGVTNYTCNSGIIRGVHCFREGRNGSEILQATIYSEGNFLENAQSWSMYER